ncbi:hypothetical protein ID866_6501 [Astraeus odoratus]|nr:hypothetical protein ID866_6501 [Astraeus odoratus]
MQVCLAPRTQGQKSHVPISTGSYSNYLLTTTSYPGELDLSVPADSSTPSRQPPVAAVAALAALLPRRRPPDCLLHRAHRDMIHLDRSHSNLDPSQNSNLILSDDHSSTTAAATHFPWDPIPHEPDNDDAAADYAALESDILAHPSDTLQSAATHLDFAVAKDRPPSPSQPTHDLAPHEDRSSPLSPAPDSASPHHDSKDLPQAAVQPKIEPPSFDKGELDVPREGTLTPLTELSPAPELDDDTEKKEEDDHHVGEASQLGSSVAEKDDVRRDNKGKSDLPKGIHTNGISSSSSSRSLDNSPVRLQPSISSPFQNTLDAASLRVADKHHMFAGPSHSRSSSSEFMTPPIIPPPHNIPPPNVAHASNNAKVIRILELNAELFNVCMEFQARGLVTDPRYQQYCIRLRGNLNWLAAAADQRQHHNAPLPAMEPPIVVEFAPIRIQHLYADLPTLFAKDIARQQIVSANSHPHSHPHPHSASHPGQQQSPLPNGNLKRNRQEDIPDLSASKRRDMGDSKMHGPSSSLSSVSPNPMGGGSMPSISGSGAGPGSASGPGLGSGSSTANVGAGPGMGPGLRSSPPNMLAGQTNVGSIAVPGTPVLPQSPPVSAVSSAGMPHPPSASLSSVAGAGGMSGAVPGAPATLPFAGADAANSRARAQAAQAQAQQVREQQLRQHQAAQMQHMHQMQAAGRHMSQPSAQTQGLQGVGGGMGGASGMHAGGGPPGQLQPPPQFQAQLLQVLQNPNHPMMQILLQQIPNFTALPQPQQMQKLQQLVIHNRQQNQQGASPAVSRTAQMVGMPQNPAMGALANGPMSGGGGSGGGPSPVSPLGQQAPGMSQPQQMSSQQSPQNGMFPFSPAHGGGGGGSSGMDPRLAANFAQQMAGNMNQQRQLMLMQQQQQQMRNANGNFGMAVGTSAPSMMNVQMYQRMMSQPGGSSQPQQQQQQQQPGAGGGSPMVPPPNDTFPALRSNAAIPGIARSTRSPSDGVHSPMTPRAPSRLSQQQQPPNDYQQAMLQQQHAQSPFGQNPNWPQGNQMGAAMGAMGSSGQVNGYPMNGAMNSPNGVGGMGGAFFSGAQSPSNQNWQHAGGAMMGVGYPYGQRPPTSLGGSAPPSATQNMSPIGDGTVNGEYDIFNSYADGQ